MRYTFTKRIFKILLYRIREMNTQYARDLRKNATECEQRLWFHLRAHCLQGFKFKRQQPIGPYIVDFICFETRCIVEADGGQHAEQIGYDENRDDWLRQRGFTVLRFWNNEILTNTNGVLERILEVCLKNRNPSPQPLPPRGGAKDGDAPVGEPSSFLNPHSSWGGVMRRGSAG